VCVCVCVYFQLFSLSAYFHVFRYGCNATGCRPIFVLFNFLLSNIIIAIAIIIIMEDSWPCGMGATLWPIQTSGILSYSASASPTLTAWEYNLNILNIFWLVVIFQVHISSKNVAVFRVVNLFRVMFKTLNSNPVNDLYMQLWLHRRADTLCWRMLWIGLCPLSRWLHIWEQIAGLSYKNNYENNVNISL
jgi:hypothetical protein